MLMKQSIQLQIPAPCHENWQEMTPVEQGRFCNSCAKTVVDFSIMTDLQILDYLSTASTGICGRLNATQLHRTIQPVPVPPKARWWMAFIMPLIMGINRVTAQRNDVREGKVLVTLPPLACKKGELAKPAEKKATRVNITGSVTDSSGAAIPFAIITLDSLHVMAMADESGVYSVQAAVTADTVTLVASSLGYTEKRYTIAVTPVVTLNIALQAEVNNLKSVTVVSYPAVAGKLVVGGAVSVVKCSTLIKDTLDKFTHFVTGKPQRFSVAPNPVRRLQQFTVMSKELDAYTVQVLNNNGAVVYVQYYKAAKGVKQSITAQSGWIPGMYYIRMIDEKTRQQYTQKIVVM